MFALLVPAGFAIVCKVIGHGDAHAKHRQAVDKAKACSDFRGAAAGVLPDADVELWRARAVTATERIKGLESIITVRARRERFSRGAAATRLRRERRTGWLVLSGVVGARLRVLRSVRSARTAARHVVPVGRVVGSPAAGSVYRRTLARPRALRHVAAAPASERRVGAARRGSGALPSVAPGLTSSHLRRR